MRRWVIWIAVVAGVVAGVALLWFLVLSPRVRGEIFRARVRAKLESADPAVRRDAAESIAEKPDAFLVTRIAQAVYGEEQDPSVAAAYVAALGAIGDPQQLPAVRFATESHQPGEIRAAAWLALAQIDRREFESLAAGNADGDEWQALGIAHGRLMLGDLSGVDTLLREAKGEDPTRAAIACRVLDQNVRPLLVEIGQWPLRRPASTAWPRSLTKLVSDRVAGVDLSALAADSARAAAGVEPIRSTLNRIFNARERIANWLTDPENHRWIP